MTHLCSRPIVQASHHRAERIGITLAHLSILNTGKAKAIRSSMLRAGR